MNNSHNIHYYFSDNTKIDSKIIALEYEKIKKETSILYYHDEFYDNVNWKIEPNNTLSYYYLEQAKKIRDEYNYIILCYSGGIDSTNILETFFYNKIKLDKIITLGAISQDDFFGSDQNHNGELYYNVFPYIKKLGLENIFQVIDYTDFFVDLQSPMFATPDWINNVGNWFSPNLWIWRDLHKYVIPEHLKKQKVAIIFGRDKPILNRDEQGYYFNFPDVILNTYGFSKGSENVDIINFYWDPTFPEILIKQLHILKKFKTLNQHINLIPHTSCKSNSHNNLEIGKLIYDLKNPLNFISPKSSSTIFSLRDSYLINKKNSKIYEIYSKGIKSLFGRLNTLNIAHRFSRKYYIS